MQSQILSGPISSCITHQTEKTTHMSLGIECDNSRWTCGTKNNGNKPKVPLWSFSVKIPNELQFCLVVLKLNKTNSKNIFQSKALRVDVNWLYLEDTQISL